jgi:hypothetical protein
VTGTTMTFDSQRRTAHAATILGAALCSLLLVAASASHAAPPETPGQAQLWTYETSVGERYFALSLTPDVEPPAMRSIDVVIVFDTSASQTGLYRVDGIEALKTMLGSLQGDVRVHLMAGDLNAVPMSEGFTAPDSSEMVAALEKLEQRVPLGSTDMNAVLRGAMEALPESGSRSRQIVYIGDGLSRANLLESEEFGRLVGELIKDRITVSSFAIGPEREIALLAALANHTGGMVYLDANENSIAQQAGLAMAQVVLGPVVWATSVEVSPDVPESYPSPMPAMRLDRDSIVIGRLGSTEPLHLKVAAEVDGRPVDLEWTVSPEPSSDDFGYLPRLVEEARADSGLALATIGTAGLHRVGNQVLNAAGGLAELATRAMKTGDVEGARRIAESVLQRDPNNPQALIIMRTIEKQEAQGDDESLILGPDE